MSLSRPAPLRTEDNHGFWDACAEGRLVAQQCASCERLRHPPRPLCPQCGSMDHRWQQLSGEGTVYSYSLLHHPQHPAFTYPVVAALVDLDEGVRLLTNVVDCDPGEVRIGMRVAVTFETAGDDLAVPVFAPAVAS